jgi:hypothetical protein
MWGNYKRIYFDRENLKGTKHQLDEPCVADRIILNWSSNEQYVMV